LNSSNPNVLVCGHRSFAARGLVELLQAAGCTVTTFSRGSVSRDGIHVTGAVDHMHENPELPGPYDIVINYILLKDETIERNNAYLNSLLRFCESRQVKHLIHLSSMSVYASEQALINEQSIVETVPDRKGSYGSLKVASDLTLINNTPAELKLTMVRPGFILGPGLGDPMVGMGLRLGKNNVLLMGATKNVLPLTTRELVNDAIVRIVMQPNPGHRDVFLLADKKSPSRLEWLRGCCKVLGSGARVVSMPVPLWYLMGFGGGIVAKLAGMKLQPNKIARNVCRSQSYDASVSEKKLGMNFSIDWPKELSRSFNGQEKNYKLPYAPLTKKSLPGKQVTYIGFGQVVKQKHLPALKQLEFAGNISAFDVAARTTEDGHAVEPLENAKLPPSDLIVVASPGPVHNQAIPLLQQQDVPVLIEKPLCYRADELDAWVQFSTSRKAPVTVCQNYRFKTHVEKMIEHLRKYEPGKLLQVDLSFHSPSVVNEWRTWTRNERRARTLLMDYSIHYLDVACMFATQDWSLGHARYETDYNGHTNLIEGRLNSSTYPVNFVLRQGFMPRRAMLRFTFQNYLTFLGFYPDTFVAQMAHDGPALYAMQKKQAFNATLKKVIDKVTNRDSDPSHGRAYLAATDATGDGLRVQALASFYQAIFQLGQAVYE